MTALDQRATRTLIWQEFGRIRRFAVVEFLFTILAPAIIAGYLVGLTSLASGHGASGLVHAVDAVTGWWPDEWDPVGALVGLEGWVTGALVAIMLARGLATEQTPADAARLAVSDQVVASAARLVSGFAYAIALGVAGTRDAAWFVAFLALTAIGFNSFFANALGAREWTHLRGIDEAHGIADRCNVAIAQLASPSVTAREVWRQVLKRLGLLTGGLIAVWLVPLTRSAVRTDAALAIVAVTFTLMMHDYAVVWCATLRTTSRRHLPSETAIRGLTLASLAIWPLTVLSTSPRLAGVVLVATMVTYLVHAHWRTVGGLRRVTVHAISTRRDGALAEASRHRERLAAQRPRRTPVGRRPRISRPRRLRR